MKGGVREDEEDKGVQIHGYWTLGGELTMQYTDVILRNRTPLIYIMLLTNVFPIDLIKFQKFK